MRRISLGYAAEACIEGCDGSPGTALLGEEPIELHRSLGFRYRECRVQAPENFT